MLPDITLKNYYLQFIYKAKVDIYEYNNKLKELEDNINNVIAYIQDYKSFIRDNFNIDLDKYSEWTSKEYDNKENLYKRVIKANDLIVDNNLKVVAIQLIKYCAILKLIYKYNKLIVLANKRKDVKFRQYRTLVNKYYVQVHKCVLEGNGYKYGYGIGTYCINLWNINKDSKHRKIIDFAATNNRKKELIAKGVKLYDDKEAAWYKARNIPYDGVDYRIYKEDSSYYEFTFIKSKLFRNKWLEYKRTEYVVNKYRGMSYVTMAEKLCHTIDDIYNLQVDIKYKLNILLYKNPNKYLNFIRNEERTKYKH